MTALLDTSISNIIIRGAKSMGQSVVGIIFFTQLYMGIVIE